MQCTILPLAVGVIEWFGGELMPLLETKSNWSVITTEEFNRLIVVIYMDYI